MSQKIDAALSEEEWNLVGNPPTMFARAVDGMLTARPDRTDDYRDGYLALDPNKRPDAAIALYNAKLRYSDQRKITRRTIQLLRGLATAFEPDDGVHSWLPRLADALESYLPPEK